MKSNQGRAVPATSKDPVTTYARRVLAKKVIAGPHVRAACQRHLDDLQHAAQRGFFFDRKRAAWAIGYFEAELRLAGGDWEGKPFVLADWQRFVVGSVHGWVDAEGLRRFRVVYVETGKGSGKSPLAAGMGLYGLTSDGEQRPEIYAAATKKDQAMVLFRDAVAMVDQSLELRRRIVQSGSTGNVWNLAYHKVSGFFRPISADDGQSGPRPHVALLDEIHEHRNGNVVEMLRAGTKSRKQALIFMITNSGSSRTSYCYDRHDYAIKVCAGQLKDDAFFGYVCGLDVDDDPIHDEKCWAKANPSLYLGLPGLKYLREQVTEARGMPAKESVVRRLNFCQWVEAESPWIGPDVWFDASQDSDFDQALLENRRAWGGLDLSSTQDITAFALLFEPSSADSYWRLKTWFWLPGDDLGAKADRDRVPYITWRDAGYLHALAGRAIDKYAVLAMLSAICERYQVQEIGYDRWRIEDFKALIEREGITIATLVEFGQGYKDMAPAVDEFERLLISRELKHDDNPVMTWCAANAVVSMDPAGNRKIAKERANGRVDGVVAAVMAAGRAMGQREEPTYSGELRVINV
jgi:phage terminase large subunit-like protein